MQRYSNAIANFGAVKVVSRRRFFGHLKESIAFRVAGLMAFNLKIARG
jgi:hypothetical protein